MPISVYLEKYKNEKNNSKDLQSKLIKDKILKIPNVKEVVCDPSVDTACIIESNGQLRC